MDAALLALADTIAKAGPTFLLALGFLLVVLGILRPGKLVDAERDRIIAERDGREKAIVDEWARREGILTKERDDWRDRSIATDERLDRVAAAFSRLSGTTAPD